MHKYFFAIFLTLFSFVSNATAQRAEITIGLNEAFFDALLDSTFQNFDPPEFSIAKNDDYRIEKSTYPSFGSASFQSVFGFSEENKVRRTNVANPPCAETVKLLREMNGIRTAVRFREGKVFVPLAFSGNYAPPFIGCLEFAGWAETNVDLEFDQGTQRLVGRACVLNVNLNGTGGIGGTVIAKLIQGSIDKKLNPIEIINLEKISFGVPIPNAGNLKMKAVAVRPELHNGLLKVHITYDFLKG